MNDRATEALLNSLHGLVADSFVEEIRRCKASGEPIQASLLAQAAKFLKDNGIDAPAREEVHIDTLADELESVSFDAEGNVIHMKAR